MNRAVRRTGTYFHSSASSVGAAQRARAPDDAARRRKAAQAVDAERVELAVLGVGER